VQVDECGCGDDGDWIEVKENSKSVVSVMGDSLQEAVLYCAERWPELRQLQMILSQGFQAYQRHKVPYRFEDEGRLDSE
jgi:hypothetical protein